MRVSVVAAFIACAAGCVALTANAQPVGVGVDVSRGNVHVDVGARGTAPGATILRTRDVTGLRVYNANNESLGKIEDLVIDPQAGKIRYAVLTFGGILGMGDKYFAVPWSKLSFVSKGTTRAGTAKEDYAVLDLPKDTLKNAPGFDKDHWPDFADRAWHDTIEHYYGAHRAASTPRTPR